METNPLVKITSVVKRFNGAANAALNKVSANIHAGKITGLVGPDGSGKTTLIRLITGLMHPNEGEISVLNYNTKTESSAIHKITGYMPQKFGLYEDLSVIENLKLYAELLNISRKLHEEKFERLLTFTTLKPFQSRLAGNLSGGMKQKLGLACALIGDPKLLLLDEPTVGVDPISRRELWKMVQDLLKEGMGVVWSTSYLDEAEKCDSVILISNGEKLYEGHPNDLLSNVEGRTWQIQGLESEKRRSVLTKILSIDGVVDSIIQGRNIRVVTAKNKDVSKLYEIKPDENIEWVSVKPSFEDAFIDLLGGGPGGKSELAKRMKEKSFDTKPVISAQGLTKRFGSFVAVQNNSFTIKRGEIFGLLGPNGAGKSTTFKMMCGLLQPTEGTASIMGLDLKTSTSKARSLIGYMAQKFSLYGHLSVRQNLNFFSGLYGLSRDEQEEKVNMMIDIFDFKNHLKENAQELPLGFKQRLSLACAVMHEPEVLFLDEPTSGVDPITRREFWTNINAMVQKGITVMVTTHFMDEAEYCDRIGLIYRGQNIATGTPDDLKKMVATKKLPDPTLEDAFIALVHQTDINLQAKL